MISAFIKSIRGSDADAGLYWLARMLEAGEDARFIARRLVILASEDVGEADPQALVVADGGGAGGRVRRPARGAAQPGAGGRPPRDRTEVEPERPRRSGKRPEDVRHGPAGEVPVHLRDADYQRRGEARPRRGMTILTTTPRAGCRSEYLPAEVADRTYYEPSDHGFEQEIRARMERTNGAETATELAAMDTSDIAAVIVAIASVVAVVLLVSRSCIDPDADESCRERSRSCAPRRSRWSTELRSTVRRPTNRARAASTPARHRRVDLRHGRLGVAARRTSRSRTRSSRPGLRVRHRPRGAAPVPPAADRVSA